MKTQTRKKRRRRSQTQQLARITPTPTPRPDGFNAIYEIAKAVAVCFAAAAVRFAQTHQHEGTTPSVRRVKKVQNVSSKVVATEIQQ